MYIRYVGDIFGKIVEKCLKLVYALHMYMWGHVDNRNKEG